MEGRDSGLGCWGGEAEDGDLECVVMGLVGYSLSRGLKPPQAMSHSQSHGGTYKWKFPFQKRNSDPDVRQKREGRDHLGAAAPGRLPD